MYLDWVLVLFAIICICILSYAIYRLSTNTFPEGFRLQKTLQAYSVPILGDEYTINTGSSQATNTVTMPNIEVYNDVTRGNKRIVVKNIPLLKQAISFTGNTPSDNITFESSASTATSSVASVGATATDISGAGMTQFVRDLLFSASETGAQFQLYGYIKEWDLPSNSNIIISIYGNVSNAAKEEFQQSINYSTSIYLANPYIIQHFIALSYNEFPDAPDNFIASISLNKHFCMPDIEDIMHYKTKETTTRVIFNSMYWNGILSDKLQNTKFFPANQIPPDTEKNKCNTVLTDNILRLIPNTARNFIIEWIYSRSLRYKRFYDTNEKDRQMRSTTVASWTSKIPVKRTIPNLNAVSQSSALLDNISQQFYDMLGGAFSITYIYDVFDVGTTMLDMRINLSPGISDDVLKNLSEKEKDVARIASKIEELYNIAWYKGSSRIIQGAGNQRILGKAEMDDFIQMSSNLNVEFEQEKKNLQTLKTSAAKIIPFIESIAQLKSQYNTLLNKGENKMTDSMLTQAKIDYDQELLRRVGSKLDNNILPPAKGALIRIFFDPATLTGTNINVTGFITDPRAVTSFVKEFNGGLDVPVGDMPGNANYYPTILYDENKSETLNCTDRATIKRMITDYTTNIGLDTSILMNATPSFDMTDKVLFVSEVTHAAQVSPTQCAFRWKEYDADTYNTSASTPNNIARAVRGSGSSSDSGNGSGSGSGSGSSGTPPYSAIRTALISYTRDIEVWNNTEITFDLSGLRFFQGLTIPACVFDPYEYKQSVYPRLMELGTTPSDINAIKADFIVNNFKDGNGQVCPNILPYYIFNDADYISANSLPTTTNTITHYKTTGIQANLPIKAPITLQPLAQTVTFVKPPLDESYLDNLSGLCPKQTCQDIDVLYSLTDQYNNDPTYPGTIMAIMKSVTANPYQCDIEADVVYDSQITDFVTDKPIDKGAVDYSKNNAGSLIATPKAMPYTGMSRTKMSLYLGVNKLTCNIELSDIADISKVDSGAAIQTNTPPLFSPLIYTKMLKEKASVNNTAPILSEKLSTVAGSARKVIADYNTNTGSAVAKILSPFVDYSTKIEEPVPLKARSFGLDRERNSKGEYTDAYKTMQFNSPLQQEPTVEPQEESRGTPYKFLRFRPVQTRNPASKHVHVGKFVFYHGEQAIQFSKGTVTNPMGTWEGRIEDVTGAGTPPGWIDTHKKPLVFAFPAPILVNGYRIQTPPIGTDPGCDPVSWILEGSTNGTFWTVLDRRTNYPTPVQRSSDTWIERF